MAIAPAPVFILGKHGREVGQVIVEATLTNEFDVALADRGLASAEDIRSVTVSDMLVDTGATSLALPLEFIRRLGLRHFRDVEVRTANGDAVVGLYKDATISLLGRSGTFECLALADGTTPLLGCIPMEWLGLEPDLANRTLRVLPEWGRDTYLML
ncbi:MAG: retroviral-like aspartic protease family protein [Dehalococcoidia bacterium]